MNVPDVYYWTFGITPPDTSKIQDGLLTTIVVSDGIVDDSGKDIGVSSTRHSYAIVIVRCSAVAHAYVNPACINGDMNATGMASSRSPMTMVLV